MIISDPVTLIGLGGMDDISGGIGDDFLDGGEDSDTLTGGPATTHIYSVRPGSV